MTIYEDSAGQKYVEIPLPDGESLRITYITKSKTIRVQIYQADGYLRKGPEIPVESVHEFVWGMNYLLAKGNDV